MNRWFNITLTTVGATLLLVGYHSAHSAASVLSHIIRGRPTNEAMWILVAGGISLLAGLVGLFREK